MPGPMIKDRDNGYAKLREHYTSRMSSYVDVGVLGDEAAEEREDADTEGLTNVLLAGVHEFGREDGTIPERSWNRAWVDENEGKVRGWIRRLAKQVELGRLTRRQALGQLGELIAAGMKDRIKKGIDPPLEPETEARKGSSTPLIDTGIMINSITHKVRA